MAEKDNRNLFYLNELPDFKVAGDDPDIRGWKVKDRENKEIGKVDNLLINKEAKKVVYLDVELDEAAVNTGHDSSGTPTKNSVQEFTNEDGENHVIIPVGMVGINHDERFVFTDELSHSTFAKTNRFRKGTNIDRKYENYVIRHYSEDPSYEDRTDDTLYERREFDDTRWRK